MPSEHIDPAALDLTHLVNALINSSQSGSRQLFSLLSVTSYSSLALHKLTLLVYNISGIRSVEAHTFRRRFCYCVTNETNDLTDFTAILLDVMGNSTSYVHELFKSSSILSVSQRNNSDCIYICVMAGKSDGEASELWKTGSITPLFNQTVVEGPHAVADISSLKLPAEWHQLPTNLSHVSPSGMSSALTSRVLSTAHGESLQDAVIRPSFFCSSKVSDIKSMDDPKVYLSKQHNSSFNRTGGDAICSNITNSNYRKNNHFITGLDLETTNESCASCPWRRPELSGESVSSSTMAIGAHKLQPCVLELCKFFSQCLCRPFNQKTRMKRYCDDSQVWYEQHTTEVCRRVRRVSFSRNLKQRCLTKMCKKL
ncbi:HERV-H LTR-associating protein 1 [Xenentodon cancila]